MTDITDQDRRAAMAWAKNWQGDQDGDTSAAARVIIATVDAPDPTLSEELRKVAADYDRDGYPEPIETYRHLADRAAQMEHDLTEARAEVERLTAERNPNGSAAQLERDGDAPNQVVLDPADVEPGEAWIVKVRGEIRLAIKDAEDIWCWSTVNADGNFRSEINPSITPVSRLVPAPRVITNADELEQLAATSIIRDGRGWPGGVTDQGVIMINGFCVSDEDVLERGPATVLWEPEA